MNTCNEIPYNTIVNSAVEPLTQVKEGKTSWYSIIKADPEALVKFKEYSKQRYEERKKVIKEKAELGIIVNKPTQDNTYKKIDPELKKRYNANYYNTHRDTVNNHKRRQYHEVIKTSPEKLESERTRIRLYQQQKFAIPEERERIKQYGKEYKRKLAILKQNKLNIDSEASTKASDSEELK